MSGSSSRVSYYMVLVPPESLSVVCADSRRAIFHIGNSTYQSKLVDLPCLIESQKTLDSKQMFKVADICQVRLPSPPLLLPFLSNF